jgi:hypothetical protein
MSNYIILPLISFVAMFAQDIMGVCLVRAEAQGRSHAAGNWDAAGDACRMAWFYCGGDALFVSRNILLSVLVIGFTLLADKWGTYWGCELGKKLDSRREAVRGTSV